MLNYCTVLVFIFYLISVRLVAVNFILSYNGSILMHWNVFLKKGKFKKSLAKQYVPFCCFRIKNE